MIRTDKEFEAAQARLITDMKVIEKQRACLTSEGMTSEEIEVVLQPLISFHEQLRDEVRWYERVRNGDIGPIEDMQEMGLLLIGLRIYKKMTQKQLAEKLGVSEAQVSRDERNEYHGITVERIQRIVDALESVIEVHVKQPQPRELQYA